MTPTTSRPSNRRRPLILAAWAMPVLALACGVQASADNLATQGDFEAGTIQEVIQWRSHAGITLQAGDAAQGKQAMVFPAGVKGDVVLKPIDAQADRAYSLRFKAKVQGPGAVADDIAMDPDHATERVLRTRGLATWRVEFRDEQDKVVGRGHPTSFQRIIHSDWTEYREDLYAPAGATQLRLIFSNGSEENTLALDDVQLTLANLATVNVNPDLALGDLNFSGYNYSHRTRMANNPQDGRYLDTTPDGWIIADPFPIEQRRYRLTFKARRADSAGRPGVRLQFVDDQGKKISESVTTPLQGQGDWREYVYEFAPPANAVRARLIFGGQGHWASFHIVTIDQAD